MVLKRNFELSTQSKLLSENKFWKFCFYVSISFIFLYKISINYNIKEFFLGLLFLYNIGLQNGYKHQLKIRNFRYFSTICSRFLLVFLFL